jgi:soluble lytic murein transglycosylase-like protein
VKAFKSIAVAVFVATALPVMAAEVATLQNGFSIRYERRELRGDLTRLYLTADSDSSYVDVPTSQIAGTDPAPAESEPASAAASTKPEVIQESIANASFSTGIDRDLIESIIHNESSFNPHAISSKGARGLMQLMPSTAQELGVKDVFDPQANVDGGSRYLRELLLQYHSDLAKALAAYNAGPQRVAQYNGVPPYRETYAYVSRVIREFNRKKMAEQALQHQSAKRASQRQTAFQANVDSSEHGGDAQ